MSRELGIAALELLDLAQRFGTTLQEKTNKKNLIKSNKFSVCESENVYVASQTSEQVCLKANQEENLLRQGAESLLSLVFQLGAIVS